MIINNNAIKIDSNVEPTKAMNFGISDVRLVVDILSKLYAYPIRTLVQEYICNGRDAMREGGTWGKVPIEIEVPNSLSPVFKVRDFGVGISPDRMENIFVNYGSSTKRNTNTQTGGFGIGAKSAFSYTDSFTVISYFNGIKYLYVAHLGDSGGVSLISSEKTSQPNGVEISIGVKPKDIAEFREAVQRCVRFWSEPIKFIGSKDIHQLKPSLTLNNMTAYDCAIQESRTVYLIDGIEYSLMDGEVKNYWQKSDDQTLLHVEGRSLVAINVPNGVFKIASSRERLENNDDNKTKQNKLLADARTEIANIISRHINNGSKGLGLRLENKKTYSCFRLIATLNILLGNNFQLRGDYVSCPSSVSFRYLRKGRRKSTRPEVSSATSLALSIVVYTGADNVNTIARKLNHYLESNKDAVLVEAQLIANIPFQDVLFTNRIDADALPLPPKKTSQTTKKSARDSICWRLTKEGRSQMSIEVLNKESQPIVIVEESSLPAIELSSFMRVFIIPKCNKDLVTKKSMTIEQAKKHLLPLHKGAEDGVTGLYELPEEYKRIKVLSHFPSRTQPDALTSYLLVQFPELQKKLEENRAEYKKLEEKYPLLVVLRSLSRYDRRLIQILIDEINKQSEEINHV